MSGIDYIKCSWEDCRKRATHEVPLGPPLLRVPRRTCTEHAFEIARQILESREFRQLVWALELFYRIGKEGERE
ncbi:MAG: hypothetical protein KatS3mg015_2526 [Fimbriimonadales bacterium]|nr:MAG: hypothetical protein KatS3mg015_2526 [Fimbriimonadales bacterium]